ncbi:unnamed protein product [Vitrella brassicaformis CCMP3155]|uniref:Uncharacterized protein n=2 Tax=Vitrella brassicaformis TaxID=1169539 RepID=A0A0G4EFY1_VITBC|nr:unnamed protein product [Vitrella brassicaformis CCMP3155]|eukprot:CEL94607.1 unnamed protein product [Vitrella brassicaformis CCMP3155]
MLRRSVRRCCASQSPSSSNPARSKAAPKQHQLNGSSPASKLRDFFTVVERDVCHKRDNPMWHDWGTRIAHERPELLTGFVEYRDSINAVASLMDKYEIGESAEDIEKIKKVAASVGLKMPIDKSVETGDESSEGQAAASGHPGMASAMTGGEGVR